MAATITVDNRLDPAGNLVRIPTTGGGLNQSVLLPGASFTGVDFAYVSVAVVSTPVGAFDGTFNGRLESSLYKGAPTGTPVASVVFKNKDQTADNIESIACFPVADGLDGDRGGSPVRAINWDVDPGIWTLVHEYSGLIENGHSLIISGLPFASTIPPFFFSLQLQYKDQGHITVEQTITVVA